MLKVILASMIWNADNGEWMVKWVMRVALLWWIIGVAKTSHAASQFQKEFSADAIRLDCSVSFFKQFHTIRDDPLSTSPFDVSVQWHCRDGEATTIDKYEINGSSPEVVTFFYWQGHSIVVLVKWSVNSQASDYVGDYYKIFSYRYEYIGLGRQFIKNETIMKSFPPGVDGHSRSGARIVYPFKDAISIRKRLRILDINN